jgi:phenylalanyl-tRNA synthetase beta chain
MRLPISWLEELVPLPADDALVDGLSMCGFEDVMVHTEGPDLSEIVVGHVEQCERHPNADKLSVCTVDVGEEARRTIVCGAPNVAAGQRVAVARSGVRLPDGTKLKRSKLRGVVSEGMICSRRELELGDDQDGILVLAADAAVGRPLPEVMPSGSRVLEVGITPNRGDAASALGLAREIAAVFGGAPRLPDTALEEQGAAAADAATVTIEAADGCYHYVARVVRGVRVGPSPDWLRDRLEACGIRSVNNVVDVTNIVLMELGQPLHAFDLERLAEGQVRVRRARAGERLVTLDGQDRALDPRDLVIADTTRPVAIAGVMGGADSEVSETTTDVLLESAHFHPSSVRLSARRHGLHSEASYRFERGIDRDGVVRAANRAARLLAELAGGAVAPGTVEARGETAPTTAEVQIEASRVNRVLGTELDRGEAAALLERVGIATREEGEDGLVATIPSHRNDLHLREDLIEEIARIYGYERIPTTLPTARLEPAEVPAAWTLAERTRDGMTAEGLIETMTFPFVSEGDLAALRLAEDDPRRHGLRLLNPIQDRDGRLRTLLAPSLLRVAQQNRNRQIDRVGIFEVCRVFLPRGEGTEAAATPAREPLTLGALVTRGQDRRLWGPAVAPPLFFELKGVAERLLTRLGYVASLRRGGNVPFLHPGAQAGLEVSGQMVGCVGELHPEVAAAFELDVPGAYLEVDLTALQTADKKDVQFREVSREPAIRRDLAALFERGCSAGEVVEGIRKAAGPDLISVELFDRYEGEGVPGDRVSLAFRLVFQRADRTLADTEVAKSMDRVVRTLTHRFGAELR